MMYDADLLNLIDFTSRILFFYFFIELAYISELMKHNKGKSAVLFLIFTHYLQLMFIRFLYSNELFR